MAKMKSKAAHTHGGKGMKIASHSESLMKKAADGKHATEHHAKIMKTPGHGKWGGRGGKGSKSMY